MPSDDDPTPTGAPDPTPPDPAHAAYERSEELIAMRKQERELEAAERGLERKLETFSADVEHTRKAEDAEYFKAHWNHGREPAGEDAAADDPPAADGDG